MMRRRIPSLFLTGVALAGFLQAAYPQSEEQLQNEGIQALDSKNFPRAREIFSRLVESDPSGKNVGYLAVAESGDGDLPQAIADFKRSIRLGNDSALTRYGLGTAYLRNNQYEAAVRELRVVVARDPAYVAAQYALGVALVNAGHPHDAIPYLERAQTKTAANPQFWLTLIRAQFEAGNSQAAIKLADQALAAIPDAPLLAEALGQLCIQHHQMQEARNLLETAIELQPKDPTVKLLLAHVCLRTGDPGETLTILEGLPPESGQPGEMMFLRGEARVLLGNLVVAQSDLSAALEADPQNAEYLLAPAWLDQIDGRYNEALAALTKARRLNPEMPGVLYRMAISYFFLGNYSQAVSNSAAAIRLAPQYDQAYLLLGVSRLQAGDFRGAQAALRRATALVPNAAFYHRELGVALYKMGMLSQSETELNRAVSLNPEAAQAYLWQARVRVRRGERTKAIDDLETAVTLAPGFSEAYSALAELYSAEGQTRKAAAASSRRRKIEKSEAPAGQDELLFPKELTGPAP